MAVLSNTGIRAGASGVAADHYRVKRSTRFNDDDSAYLNWQPGAAGDRDTWTFSCWVKRSTLVSSDRVALFSAYGALNNTDFFEFGYDNDRLFYTVATVTAASDAVFRDTSAWHHVVCRYDGSTLKFYSNGTEVKSVSVSGNLGINGAWDHRIGMSSNPSDTRYLDGYLADVHFIDGTAKAPTDFAETNADTGQWVPKEYSGSYGTNGFHLAMDPDNSGTDYSGTAVDAVGGSMPNGGTPYIIDLSPADAQFQYYTNTQGAYNIFNGRLDGSAAGQVYCSDLNESTVWTFDLRDEGTITSVKLYAVGGEDYGSTADGDNWVASLLDSSKSAIANTSVTISDANYQWFTVPVAGTPRYLKFTQLTGTGPLWLQGIQVNGRNLVNHTSIGYDSSGNKNHWHGNNVSTTAGVGNDLLADTPGAPYDNELNGGGNYATLNPLACSDGTPTKNGNLGMAASTGGHQVVAATMAVSSGKWWWEGTIKTLSPDYICFGMWDTSKELEATLPGYSNTDMWSIQQNTGKVYYNGHHNSTTINTFAAGDDIAIAYDNGSCYVYKDGVVENSGNPVVTGLTGDWAPIFHGVTSTWEWEGINFGQRPFKYTPRSGHKALNTYNLTDPTITDPSTAFAAKTYTGNGASSANGSGGTQTIDCGFAPDLVWIKSRSTSGHNHNLLDIVRGAPNILCSDNNVAEITNSTDSVTAFTSDGFTLGDNGEGTQSVEIN